MALTIECTDCRKKYAVSEQSAGKRVKCKNCGNVFAVPASHAGMSPQAAPAGAVGAPGVIAQHHVAGADRPPQGRPLPTPPPAIIPTPPPPPIEDPFDPDYNPDSALSALEADAQSHGNTYAAARPPVYAVPSAPARPSKAVAIASGAANVAGGVAVAAVPMAGHFARNLGIYNWIGIVSSIIALATCRLGQPICLLGLFPLAGCAVFTLVMAWYKVSRSVINNYWEYLACRLIPFVFLILLLTRLDQTAEHLKTVAKAIVLVLLTIGCYIIGRDSQQGHANPNELASFGSTPTVYSNSSAGSPSPARAASPPPPEGQSGFVNLKVVTDGYPGSDPEGFRNKVTEYAKRRLRAAGIGIDPSAKITLTVSVAPTGAQEKFSITPMGPMAFGRPPMAFGRPPTIVTVDKVVAQVIMTKTEDEKLLFRREMAANLNHRTVKDSESNDSAMTVMSWDSAGNLINEIEFPTVILPPDVQALREDLLALPRSLYDKSREQATPLLDALRARARALDRGMPNDPVHQLTPLIEEAERAVAGLPSEAPDPSVFREPHYEPMPKMEITGVSGRTSPLQSEVSFRQYMIRPPKEGLLDLQVEGIGDTILNWQERNGGPSLTIRAEHRSNPAQKQPCVATLPVIAAAARSRGLFVMDSAPTWQATRGTINGLNFVRVEAGNGRAAQISGGLIQYGALQGDDWLIIELRKQYNMVNWEDSVMSVRPLNPGEKRLDPLSPARLADRLAYRFLDRQERDAAVALLIKRGPAAEDAVLPLLSAEFPVPQSAVQVLKAVGTAKSVPALKAAARSNTSGIAQEARQALRAIAPKEFDPVGDALLDLEGYNKFGNSDPLAALADATPDEARRPAVSAKLEKMFFENNARAQTRDLGKAMGVWHTDHSIDLMLSVLNNPKSDIWIVQSAMSYAGAAKDKRLVFPVIHWINTPQHGEDCVQALIAMGPIAEDETIKVMRYNDAAATTNAARVLAKIGTKRCIAPLAALSNSTKNPGAAQAASTALLEIRSRLTATTAPAN